MRKGELRHNPDAPPCPRLERIKREDRQDRMERDWRRPDAPHTAAATCVLLVDWLAFAPLGR
jgi:hypothetical protein